MTAKEFFSIFLETQITNFCNEFNLPALANISDLEADLTNTPQFIFSFDDILICDLENPDIHQLLEIGGKLSDII